MPRTPDPWNLYQARLDALTGRVQGALWTADAGPLTALRENRPASPPPSTHLRPLIDDRRATEVADVRRPKFVSADHPFGPS